MSPACPPSRDTVKSDDNRAAGRAFRLCGRHAAEPIAVDAILRSALFETMRFFRLIPAWKILVVATAFHAVTVVAATPPRPLLEPTTEALMDFYLPPDFRGAKLAPDGRHLAMVARSGDLFSVAIFDLSTGKTSILPGLKR